MMIDPLSYSAITSHTNNNTSSLYEKYYNMFSNILDTAIDTVESAKSAYTQHSEPYSVEKHGSHIANGVQLVQGAPKYNAIAAAPFLAEIEKAKQSLNNPAAEPTISPLAAAVQNLSNPISQLLTAVAPTSNPLSAYRESTEPWSMETRGSHIVNGIQLIPGAPGYNTQSASPYHQEIAQTNAKYFSI